MCTHIHTHTHTHTHVHHTHTPFHLTHAYTPKYTRIHTQIHTHTHTHQFTTLLSFILISNHHDNNQYVLFPLMAFSSVLDIPLVFTFQTSVSNFFSLTFFFSFFSFFHSRHAVLPRVFLCLMLEITRPASTVCVKRTLLAHDSLGEKPSTFRFFPKTLSLVCSLWLFFEAACEGTVV